MGRGIAITRRDVDRMLDLRDKGCSNKEIADLTGWCRGTIIRAIGKQPRPVVRPWTCRGEQDAILPAQRTRSGQEINVETTQESVTISTTSGAVATIYQATGEVAILTHSTYMTVRIDALGPLMTDLTEIILAAAVVASKSTGGQ